MRYVLAAVVGLSLFASPALANELKATELYLVVKVNEGRVGERDVDGARASLSTALRHYGSIKAPRDVCVTAARNLDRVAAAMAERAPADEVEGLIGGYYGALGGCEMLLGKRQSKQALFGLTSITQ